MSNLVKFYQNNPCVVLRDINDDLCEVVISHKFAESMEARSFCEGCIIGDSDNKLSCTCDNYEWVIEEVQEEENRILCIVEKRLLCNHPIEKKAIDNLQSEIKKEKETLQKIKDLRAEWRASQKSIQAEVETFKKELEILNEKIGRSKLEFAETETSLLNLKRSRDELLVDVSRYSFESKKISYSDYESLLNKEKILDALDAGGVENWEWYSESIDKAGI